MENYIRFDWAMKRLLRPDGGTVRSAARLRQYAAL